MAQAQRKASKLKFRDYMTQGQYTMASKCADDLVREQPSNADHYAYQGKVHLRTGDTKAAINAFGQAVALASNTTAYITQLGDAFFADRQLEPAALCFQRALQLDCSNLQAHLGLNGVFEQQGQIGAATHHVLEAVKSHPESAHACHAAGRFLHRFGKRSDAAQFFAQAIKNDPYLPESYRVLAAYLREAGDISEAVAMYDTLLSRVPGDPISEAERVHCLAHLNDWDHPGYSEFDPSSATQLKSGTVPFLYFPFEDSPENLLNRAKLYAKKLVGKISPTQIKHRANAGRKLRIGYFSADFHDHATMHLLAGVLEAHDRESFELYAFSYGPDIQDDMRQRAVKAVDHFHDISEMSDFAAAEMARDAQLDIAIDLKGFTGGSRIAVFAHRVAPIQVAWLGYPGTSGAECMDYFIADDVVLPPEQKANFSETIVSLPDCYQPNDRHRPLPDANLTRREAGLPEKGFVFCCFNSSYKISPTEFDIWMDLLKNTGGSVLWLLDGGDISRKNLCEAAKTRDVDPSRLIFAPRVQQAEHLARLALADLFLDTFNCNAHTTASDALWAGVPVLTCPGEQFAARVAASLVTAAGVPELICENQTQYRARALELAASPNLLQEFKDRLVDGRFTCALFDTEKFTKDFEAALKQLQNSAVNKL